MGMLRAPFYDPTKTYYDNLENGPFNGFADGVVLPEAEELRFEFLGQRISYPIGIPAGPLLDGKFVSAAFYYEFIRCPVSAFGNMEGGCASCSSDCEKRTGDDYEFYGNRARRTDGGRIHRGFRRGSTARIGNSSHHIRGQPFMS